MVLNRVAFDEVFSARLLPSLACRKMVWNSHEDPKGVLQPLFSGNLNSFIRRTLLPTVQLGWLSDVGS